MENGYLWGDNWIETWFERTLKTFLSEQYTKIIPETILKLWKVQIICNLIRMLKKWYLVIIYITTKNQKIYKINIFNISQEPPLILEQNFPEYMTHPMEPKINLNPRLLLQTKSIYIWVKNVNIFLRFIPNLFVFSCL